MKTTDNMLIDPLTYNIASLDDEIRVDGLCRELLKRFHQHLLAKNEEPLTAGSMAAGTDYFLRDFMIDHLRANIFDLTAQHVRYFAGNWYIISNMEPNITELETHLCGIAEFCLYCAEHGLTNPEQAEQAVSACKEIDDYQNRIETFHAIIDNGFSAWNAACPVC